MHIDPFPSSRSHKGPRPRPVRDRLYARVLRTAGCWLWQGGVDSSGYGVMSIGSVVDRTQRSELVHRVSWCLEHGDIPDGLEVCHDCDTPRCVRPSHLFLGTNLDNAKDRAAKRRYQYGEANGQAKLTADLVRFVRAAATNGRSQRSLARELNISQSLISLVVLRKIWRHV